MYYGGRLFRAVETSSSSQTGQDTIFKYEQIGDMVTATYAGGDVRFGQILGQVDADGILNMRYHHLTPDGELMTGWCVTTPEILPNRKMRLHEKWKWTCGHRERGQSILEEI